MLMTIINLRLYIKVKLSQRGAEMLEYALVLACLCAIGCVVYGVGVKNTDGSGETLDSALNVLWSVIGISTDSALKEN